MSYDDNTIVIADKIYVPIEHVDLALADKHYVHDMFVDKACARCCHRPERPNYACMECEAYNGSVQTYSTVLKNDIEYVGFPMGERLNIERKFGISFEDFRIVDKRVRTPFDYEITTSLNLRDYQDESITAWWQYKFGLIVAPPRSGKTVVMLALAIKLGMRTILLANQHEFLQQFIEHIEEYTNLPMLEESTGKKLYGFPKNPSDFDTLQIAVSTYQQFTSKGSGKERFVIMNRNFGTLLIDEAHKGAANEFARVINNSRARIRMGVTGTDKRKDGRHKILYDIVGPVVERVDIEQLKPKLIVHVCDYVKSRAAYTGPAGYVYATRFLSTHEKRNLEILKLVGEDLNNGHNIIIPVTLKDYVWFLVKSINELYGESTAEGFVGGTSKKQKEIREGIIARARSRETRVVVGIRSILQLGLNVPAWSALYNIVPMSNEPNWKQESSRILTPYENKRQPIIRMFVDPNIALSLGCFMSTYKHSLRLGYKPTDAARERAALVAELHGCGKRSLDEAEEMAAYGIEQEEYAPNISKTHKPDAYKNVNKTRQSAIGRGTGLFGGGK